ncbi:MAG: outer membrane beta-barrel protein [Muribaculum sp.]|nr:outer membrane beta-barrel protein [Muribaculum sp.]
MNLTFGEVKNIELFIRLKYLTSVQNPALSEQQDFGRFTDSLIYKHGNPQLSNALNHKVTAMANFMRDFTISCEYNYMHNAIFDIAGLGDGMRPDGMDGYYVAYQYQNGKSSSVKANITYTKSFNFGLTVSATGSISREKATNVR